MEDDISWGERDPHEADALRSLVDADAYLQQARLKGSKELYFRAFKYAEKVIHSFPWSGIAHYIAAVSHFRASRDKNYAQQKYHLLLTFKSKEANTLAKKLLEEIEENRGGGGGAPSLEFDEESFSAPLPPTSQKA